MPDVRLLVYVRVHRPQRRFQNIRKVPGKDKLLKGSETAHRIGLDRQLVDSGAILCSTQRVKPYVHWFLPHPDSQGASSQSAAEVFQEPWLVLQSVAPRRRTFALG